MIPKIAGLIAAIVGMIVLRIAIWIAVAAILLSAVHADAHVVVASINGV